MKYRRRRGVLPRSHAAPARLSRSGERGLTSADRIADARRRSQLAGGNGLESAPPTAAGHCAPPASPSEWPRRSPTTHGPTRSRIESLVPGADDSFSLTGGTVGKLYQIAAPTLALCRAQHRTGAAGRNAFDRFARSRRHRGSLIPGAQQRAVRGYAPDADPATPRSRPCRRALEIPCRRLGYFALGRPERSASG